MISAIRVGIPIVGGQGWLGGVTYIQLLVKAVKSLSIEERPMLFFIITDKTLNAFDLHVQIASEFSRVIFVGSADERIHSLLPPHTIYFHSDEDLFDFIDFIFPVNSDVLFSRCAASWIPDFQHCYLPQFCSPQEVDWRNSQFIKVARQAKLIVFSSKTALNDFHKFYPGSQAITKILTFYSKPELAWYDENCENAQKNYNLPEKFIICCNQFWMHKNHARLIEAMSMLKQSGQEVTLVCTGSKDDYRSQGYFAQLQELIVSLGLTNNIHILGTIPREDQIQLIRRSLFVVQPSLFEGWSTVVEDCRVLGKTILLSDLAVHLEQNPNYAIYFARDSAQDLAEKMRDALKISGPGPDHGREKIARIDADSLVEKYARQFCDIVRTAVFDIGKRNFSVIVDSSSGAVSHKQIEIVTSLAPRGFELQKSAINSWIKMGFTVTSINAQDEIDLLKPHFPEVKLVQVNRDARKQYGKPFVYLDDILEYFRQSGNEICGIVNSDIHLISSNDLAAFFAMEAQGGLVFGSRIDIDNLATLEGEMYHLGFDFFFFDRKILDIFPQEQFCIGQPWWDYWLPIVPLGKGLSVKRLMTPVAYHVNHPINWNPKVRTDLGMVMAKYIRTTAAVNEENMMLFLQFVCRIIREKSKEMRII